MLHGNALELAFRITFQFKWLAPWLSVPLALSVSRPRFFILILTGARKDNNPESSQRIDSIVETGLTLLGEYGERV